jgi:hypothetical protein
MKDMTTDMQAITADHCGMSIINMCDVFVSFVGPPSRMLYHVSVPNTIPSQD